MSKRRVAIVGALAAGGLAVGGVAVAQAATPSASATPKAPAAPKGPPGPRGPHQPHIDGKVTAIDGLRLTVTDPDGFTRHITVSSSATYTKDGAKASRSVVTKGAMVHAEGKVDSDKTTLDASTVDVHTGAFRPPGPPAGGPKPPAAPKPPDGKKMPAPPHR